MKLFIDKEKKRLIKAQAEMESFAKTAQLRARQAARAVDEYQDSFLVMIGNSKWTWATAGTLLLCAVLVGINQ